MKTVCLFFFFVMWLGSQHLSSAPAPNTSLPPQIHAAADQVSLVADFEHKEQRQVTIYLVNNSQADVSIATQDGDIGAKREAKSTKGTWMRCDSHADSWCGNSYGSFQLKAGHFISWTQVCDTEEGQTRPLRFKLYGQGNLDLISNEGEGVVDERDVQFCRFDSLAMRHGPFEDIAAVATGKVSGGQGASVNGVGLAVWALGRFPTDKRLFAVVREVVLNLKLLANGAEEAARNGRLYSECLDALQKAVGSSVSGEELWIYVNGHLHDESFPWRRESLDFLVRVFGQEKEKLTPVIEEALSANGHPALRSAAFAYSKMVDIHVAGVRLASIEADTQRSELDREIVRSARESLFPNPYLSIKAENEVGWGNDGLSPLKHVTFTNISPQSITLPVARPEALLVIEVSEITPQGRQNRKQFFLDDEKGSLVIEVGQQVVIHDVKWWESMGGQKFDPKSHYMVSFQARSPTLWSIHAKQGWSLMPKGDDLLKTIKPAKPAGK